jgi:hypothetical protein
MACASGTLSFGPNWALPTEKPDVLVMPMGQMFCKTAHAKPYRR